MTSKLDVAEFRTRNLSCSLCVQKSQANDDAGVAESFLLNQARKIWMLRWQVLWLMSLIRQKSEFSGAKSRCLLPTTARHGCSMSLLSMDKIPAIHLFFLIGPIGLESIMLLSVLSRRRVFMKQLLGHCANCTRVTLRSSSRQDDQNLNLENSYVGHAETALLSSTCTVTAQSFQQGDLAAFEALIDWILLDLRYLWAKTGTNTILAAHWLLITINLILIAFIWLHLANAHFKNTWSELEMMNWH